MKTDNKYLVSLGQFVRETEQKFDRSIHAADGHKKQAAIMGALVARGSMLEVHELRPWGQPSRCIARVPLTGRA